MNIQEVKLDKIHIKENIRTTIIKDELTQLMEDIKQHGLLHPIGVTIKGEEYLLLYGHRRLEACKKLGWTIISAIVYEKNLTPEEFIAMNVSENVHRLDNSPIEFARTCQILKELGLNNSEIAIRFSVSKGKIETALRIYSRVPLEFRETIGYIPAGEQQNRKGKISATTANRIVNLRIDDKSCNEVFKLAKKEELIAADIDVVGRLIAKGIPVKEAFNKREEYVTRNVHLVINRREEMKMKEEGIFTSLVDYTSELLKKQNKKLIF